MSAQTKEVAIYPYPYLEEHSNGITFTDNGDGSVTINGTPNVLPVVSWLVRDIELPAGDYFVSTDGGASRDACVYYQLGANSVNPYGDEVEHLTLPQGETLHIEIVIWAEVNNLTLTPHVRTYSTAHQLATIAENEPKVYEAGKNAERDRFWEVFQRGGVEGHYQHAFSNGRFTDENYNPKYHIKCTPSHVTAAQYMFYNAPITDTKVEIVAGNDRPLTSAFQNSSVQTIRKLTVTSGVTYSNTFMNCTGLKNIVMQGTIGRTIDFSYSTLLTAESMKSIVSCLENFAGTSNESKYTLTFPAECWERLEADSAAPDGGTWQNYVKNLGWLV